MKSKRNMLNFRERTFKWFFIFADRYRQFVEFAGSLGRFLFNVAYFLFLLGFIFFIGFRSSNEAMGGLESAFRVLFVIIFFTKFIPGILRFRIEKPKSLLPGAFIFIFSLGVYLSNFGLINFGKALHFLFNGNVPVIIAVILIGITELSGIMRIISSVKIPPGLIFSISFVLIILLGSGFLMMPKANTGSLTYLDALFTSVSAVCVTGLIVVDTATAFTPLGKTIILCLIQVGGLGIMTFTGFFGYIFTSASSFRDKLLLKELFSAETMNNLLNLLTKIIMLTFLTEIIGALAIYASVGADSPDRVFFSVFHSVSAFCNAGFSTLSSNLSSAGIMYNIPLQVSVAMLIIFGGIGFPVLLIGYGNFKHFLAMLIRKFQGRLKPIKPIHRDVSVRIVLFMTVVLITLGALFYYLFESATSLKDMDSARRVMVSLFGSISARTAGFNIIDISAWGYPTIFLMIFLMWVGASPGSTGGGIKTTTFAIAFRTAWNYIKGRENLRIGNREISSRTTTRILTIIFLSLTMISVGFGFMLITQTGKDPVRLLFECFSAFGTVGLSLVDSSTLTSSGKVVDMILMFVGRVGPLTLLSGMLAASHKRYARYPEIDIIIN